MIPEEEIGDKHPADALGDEFRRFVHTPGGIFKSRLSMTIRAEPLTAFCYAIVPEPAYSMSKERNMIREQQYTGGRTRRPLRRLTQLVSGVGTGG
jgi:hypothetical protein